MLWNERLYIFLGNISKGFPINNMKKSGQKKNCKSWKKSDFKQCLG